MQAYQSSIVIMLPVLVLYRPNSLPDSYTLFAVGDIFDAYIAVSDDESVAVRLQSQLAYK